MPVTRVRPQQGKEEALMSLTMTVAMLIIGWLAVAAAMLWGVLRVSRRHPPVESKPAVKTDKTAVQPATAH